MHTNMDRLARLLLTLTLVTFGLSSVQAEQCSLTVTKSITNCPAPDPPAFVDLYYVGVVSNCGTAELFNVTVVDDLLTPGAPTHQVVLGPLFTSVVAGTGFQPGATLSYSGSFTAGNLFNTNMATASGNNIFASNFTATASAACTLACVPSINLTKICQNAPGGQPIPISVTVSNNGDIPLLGVTVNDDNGVPGGPLTLIIGPIPLQPGDAVSFNGSYTPPGCPSTNTVFASGQPDPSFCGPLPTVTAQASSQPCGTPGTPSIVATENCRLAGDCANLIIAFDGIVTNTGDLNLQNVTVVNDNGTPNNPADNMVVFGPAMLAAHTSATFSGTYTATNNPSTNTVVASGTSVGQPPCGGGSNVSYTASCIVPIDGVPCIMATKSCAFGDSANTNVCFSGTISNCSSGGITLEGVYVVEQNESGAAIVARIGALAPGATASFSGCYPVSNGCAVVHSDTATVIGSNLTSCAQDTREVRTTATCSTTACLQTGCRTTGGGTLSGTNTCPVVDFTTHGGQVGAPFGAAGAPNCASDTGFNNPCIRGEFTHVRHVRHGGGKNDFSFHASSNGQEHDFDSLVCACLPCDPQSMRAIASPFGECHPSDRVYSGQSALVNGLCDDRTRAGCGPFPPAAPANKICFSGVTADATVPCVFRVDLEDHGEPGGAFPKGGSPPSDRYRIRMWFIRGLNADSSYVKALRDAVACHNPLDERVETTLPCGQTLHGSSTVPAPDIDDGGDLDRGNQQIHRNTAAPCAR